MQKLMLCTIAILLCSLSTIAQPEILSNKELLAKTLNQTTFSIDSMQHSAAIVLFEKGSSYYHKEGGLGFKTERVFKVLKKEGIDDVGTIKIASYGANSIKHITATTYNLENGNILEQKVEKADILSDKLTSGSSVIKFNLPSLKEGSVVHFSYVTILPNYVFFPGWNFQSKYPTLHSEYELFIPERIKYNAIERLGVNITRVKKKKDLYQYESACFEYSHWLRKNVPAYKEEPFTCGRDNLEERVRIQLVSISNNVYTHPLNLDWNDAIRETFYKNENSCGQVFQKNTYLSELVMQLTKHTEDKKEKAKALFTFIRDSIDILRQSQSRGWWVDVRKTFEQRKGDPVAINLLLCAMCRKAGIDASPLLISTRGNESLNPSYSDLKSINYIAVVLSVENEHIFLDANSKHMPFGMLSPDCYNGYSRSVEEKSKEIVLNPDSIVDKTTYLATITPHDKQPNELYVKCDIRLGKLSSLNIRSNWLSDTTGLKKKFMKHSSNERFDFQNFSVTNLSYPDTPVIISFSGIIKLYDSFDVFYMPPLLVKLIDENPFRKTTRIHPIEMDYRKDIDYTLNFTIPDNYKVDDYPKPTMSSLREDGALSFKSSAHYSAEDRKYSSNMKFRMNTVFYSAEEHDALRAIYDALLQEQDKKVTLKKIK